MIGGKTGSLRFFGAMWKSDNSKWPRQIQLYTLFLEAFDVFVFPPPHHHHRHPAPTLTEKICVHSCRPARWSESDWRGGRVKTQAGVPFCWPESGSSHVLLQHSQQHHTVRQKVKGRQVISHTHTQHFAAEKKNPPFFSISLFICLSPHFNPIHRQQRQTNLRSLSSKRREG